MVFTPEHRKMLTSIGQQYFEFSEFIGAWREHELEFMSQSTKDNFDVSKGRVQALTEMQRLLRPTR